MPSTAPPDPGCSKHCRTLGGSKTGEVTLTPAFDLPMKAILHAVGPVWRGGGRDEAAQLRSCYAKACALCREHQLTSLAFPAISTGAYRFPLQAATEIAIATVRDALQAHPLPARVVFCCFAESDAALYRALLDR